jgi:hypothetical protein
VLGEFTDGELRARIATNLAHLDAFGEVVLRDVGRRTRSLEYSGSAPGDPCDREVETLFREYFSRTRSGSWLFAKYTYEYRHLPRKRRLAFHYHVLSGSPDPVPHAHCGSPDDPEEWDHRRAVVYDLREANGAFMKLYAADHDPTCSDFLPLTLPR